MRKGWSEAEYTLPIGRALREIRLALGWSISKAAAEMGMGPNKWSRIEGGVTIPTLAFINEFRDHTGIDPYVAAYVLYFDGKDLPWHAEELALRAKMQAMFQAMKENLKIRPGWQWT